MARILSIASDFRLDSEFVYKTSALGISRVGACVVQTHLARKPLRRIVARTPVTYEYKSTYLLTYFLDTLECQHQLDASQISLHERIAA